MSKPFYTSQVVISKTRGVRRRATLPGGGTVEFGVHGPVKEHYRLDAEPDMALPVDYLVAAAAA